MNMKKRAIITDIIQNKIIAIVRGLSTEETVKTVEALYKGGIRFAEITFDQSGKTSWEDTADCINKLAEQFKNKVIIGAGTVMNIKQVELAYEAGAEYIISPDTNETVIKKTVELSMVSIPGALTPTEIAYAYSCGADFVKIFPITSLGPDYVTAVLAPLAHIPMLAVGGINIENMNQYLNAGIKGFGIGSNIINKQYIKNGEYDKITSLAKKYTEIVK